MLAVLIRSVSTWINQWTIWLPEHLVCISHILIWSLLAALVHFHLWLISCTSSALFKLFILPRFIVQLFHCICSLGHTVTAHHNVRWKGQKKSMINELLLSETISSEQRIVSQGHSGIIRVPKFSHTVHYCFFIDFFFKVFHFCDALLGPFSCLNQKALIFCLNDKLCLDNVHLDFPSLFSFSFKGYQVEPRWYNTHSFVFIISVAILYMFLLISLCVISWYNCHW